VRSAEVAGRALGPVWTGAENIAFTGIRSQDQPVASRYTDGFVDPQIRIYMQVNVSGHLTF
jgi:hypothetical protein